MNSFPAEMTTEMAQQLMQNAKVIAKSLSDGTLPAAMAGTMNPNEIASLAAYEVDSPEFWEGMWTNLYVYYSQNEGSRALAKLGLQADKAGHVSQTNYVKFWGTLLETPTLASTNPKIAGYKHRIREFAALSRKYSTHSFAHYNNVSRVCILLGVKLQRNYVEEFEIASLLQSANNTFEQNAEMKQGAADLAKGKEGIEAEAAVFNGFMQVLHQIMPYSTLTQVYGPNWTALADQVKRLGTRPSVMFQQRRMCAMFGIKYDFVDHQIIVDEAQKKQAKEYFTQNDDGQQFLLFYKQMEGRLMQPESQHALVALRRSASGDTSPSQIYTKLILFYYHMMEEVKQNPQSQWKNTLENDDQFQQFLQAQSDSKFLPACIHGRNTLYAMIGLSPSDMGTPEFTIAFFKWLKYNMSLPRNAPQLAYFRHRAQFDQSPNQVASVLDFWANFLNYYAREAGGFHALGNPMSNWTPVTMHEAFMRLNDHPEFQKLELRKFFNMPDFDPNADEEEWYADMRERYMTYKDTRLSNM